MNINTPSRIKSFDQPSVWLEFSPLAKVTESINLGQGFPDWAPPKFVEKAAIDAAKGGHCSTYAQSSGHPKLTAIISEKYSTQLNHQINQHKEILVTVGATEALYLAIMSFVERGDEVIIIEPAFDIYHGALKMAEANIKPVSLLPTKDGISSSSEFELDWASLEKQLNKNTKMIILNTPHNPTGKVFTDGELSRLATLLDKYPDCVVIADEVYEHLVYDDNKHTSIASLPGMFDRTITISSAGKTFSVTGWKVGWAIGPEELIKRMQLCQQYVVFSVSKPHQEAIAKSLAVASDNYNNDQNYYEFLKSDYDQRRKVLFKGLKDAGLNPVMPQGSFFILCDISHMKITKPTDNKQIVEWNNLGLLQMNNTTMALNDYNFCRSLSINYKVTAIPASAFCTNQTDPSNQKWVRFAFCKNEDVLRQAITKLMSI